MSEGTVGYSEGTGTRIATHAIDKGGAFPEHHQRFAPGTGQAFLKLGIYPTGGQEESALLDCLGSGRICVTPIMNSAGVGTKYRVYFYDQNKIEMGCSEEYEIEDYGTEAYAQAGTSWVASNSYAKGVLLKRSGNSHIYQNIAAANGVSGSTEPTWPTDGTSVVDGTCEWLDCGTYTGLLVTPLTIFSNSMGASFFKIDITMDAGTVCFWYDGI